MDLNPNPNGFAPEAANEEPASRNTNTTIWNAKCRGLRNCPLRGFFLRSCLLRCFLFKFASSEAASFEAPSFEIASFEVEASPFKLTSFEASSFEVVYFEVAHFEAVSCCEAEPLQVERGRGAAAAGNSALRCSFCPCRLSVDRFWVETLGLRSRQTPGEGWWSHADFGSPGVVDLRPAGPVLL